MCELVKKIITIYMMLHHDRQVPEYSLMETGEELSVSWTAAKEKRNSEWRPLVDALDNIYPKVHGTWEHVVEHSHDVHNKHMLQSKTLKLNVE